MQAVIKLAAPATAAVAALLLALPCARAQGVAAPVAATAPGSGWTLDAPTVERVRNLVQVNLTLPSDLPAGKSRVQIDVGRLDPRLQLASCRRVEPSLPTNAALWGSVRMGLQCAEGDRAWKVWVPVTVKVLAPAVVPSRALPAGTVLAADHLVMQEVDWAASSRPYGQVADLLGRTLGRAVQTEQPLRQGDLRLRQWFASGDVVQVLARGNGFVVQGEAEALSHGLEGQPVRVRTSGGRVLSGVAVGEYRVEVTL